MTDHVIKHKKVLMAELKKRLSVLGDKPNNWLTKWRAKRIVKKFYKEINVLRKIAGK